MYVRRKVEPMDNLNEILKDHSLILFDGECNLCDNSVQFIIKRDPNAYFKFAPSQASIAQDILLREFGEDIPDSVILINSQGVFSRSSAVLRIASKMKWPWKVFAIFRIIPPFILNPFYRLVAKFRKKIWGSKEACMLPSPELNDRFL